MEEYIVGYIVGISSSLTSNLLYDYLKKIDVFPPGYTFLKNTI